MQHGLHFTVKELQVFSENSNKFYVNIVEHLLPDTNEKSLFYITLKNKYTE